MATNPRGLAYADPAYAASLREFGTPVPLTRSGGWVLARPIPDTSRCDAMGSYPLFACRDWTGLPADLAELGDSYVSCTVVTDPFGSPPEARLKDVFDVVVRFKDHYILDLDLPPEQVVARHHQKSVRRAQRAVTVEVCDPTAEVDTFARLYDHLVARHDITGIRAFSRDSFKFQASIPGLVAPPRATVGEEVVGIHWYLTAGDVVYAHLAAMHVDSYKYCASHTLFWNAIQRFHGTFRWLDLGAAPGAPTAAAVSNPLAEFKAGWSSGTAPTYVCGRILDPVAYRELAGLDPEPSGYFPAYRRGEFTPVAAGR